MARDAEITRHLRERISIDPAAIRDLAMRRAAAIRDRLVAGGSVSAERVFVLDVTVDRSASTQAPHATLSLTAE